MKKHLSIFLFASLLAFASSCQKEEADASSTPIEIIAFGSCNRQNLPQPLWNPINEDHPDLWIWMGDNIYGDSPIMDTLKAKYEIQNQVVDYQELKKSTPMIGIWDDHDYGINDGGKYFSQKDASKQLMLDFLGVPEDAPERKRDGAYSSHLFGQGENLVKVLLLDARYFRDTLERIDRVYKTNETGEVLGEAQWKWLEEELKNSPAKVHLIVSGIQMLPVEHAYEKWANFPPERERLLNLISESGAGTPILLSGDRHIAEIMKLKDERFPQGLYEITSSGLTHTWGSISDESNQFRIGDIIAKLNYGLARFDWEREEVLFEIKGKNGDVYASQKIHFTK